MNDYIKADFFAAADSLKAEGRAEYELSAPLSRCCTFRIGGPADMAVWPGDIEALSALVCAAENSGTRYFICGSASNILFSDEGFRGAIIFTTKLKKICVSGNTIHAECGAPLSLLAMAAQRASLSGLEFAYGIPGSLGGAVFMNAGAYGGEMSQILISSEYLSPKSGKISSLSAAEHDFGYRHSLYMERDDIILSAVLELVPGDGDEIQRKMDENMDARRSKQPLESPSAGSMFKRAPGHFTSALIDGAGLKGYKVGGAEVSSKHAGFVINTGDATAADVIALTEHISSVIFEKYGVEIEREVRTVGP
ncbi:MAG TPA: UDP-N-acetylmuramate dehydrogenase [Clostridiales bacterium]|jgi:UDP-N-acetylmuramate dehydrogenase|nr:UDP-N-acetylmuramate dehydrogenase [Clostridiales bacterium]